MKLTRWSCLVLVLAVGCSSGDGTGAGGAGGGSSRGGSGGSRSGGNGGRDAGMGGSGGIAGTGGSNPNPDGPPSGGDAAGGTSADATDGQIGDADDALPSDGPGPTPDGAVDGLPPAAACDHPSTRKVSVATAPELKAALLAAVAGDLIELSPGTYVGKFVSDKSGLSGKPIVLCGPRTAMLDGMVGGNALHVKGNWQIISGFSIRGGLKGIMLDNAFDNVITGVEVSGTLQEAVHFRMGSSRNTLIDSHIHDTGLRDAQYGEGVYIGSAMSNGVDEANDNKILNNVIEKTAAECIDIKENSKGGLISGNTMDGSSIQGANFADSLIDLKGSDFIIEKNKGINPLLHGFEIHSIDGAGNSGHQNIIRDNTFTLKASSALGIWVEQQATGNEIACSNTVTGGTGLTNVTCSN